VVSFAPCLLWPATLDAIASLVRQDDVNVLCSCTHLHGFHFLLQAFVQVSWQEDKDAVDLSALDLGTEHHPSFRTLVEPP
jgi:hypothetical protein